MLELPKGVFPCLRFKLFCRLASSPLGGCLVCPHPSDHFPHLCSPSCGPSSKLLESIFLEFASSVFQELLGGRVHGRGSECRPWISCLGWKPGSSLYSLFVVGQSLMVSGHEVFHLEMIRTTSEGCCELAELAWVKDSGRCLLFLFPEIHFETNLDSIFILVTVCIPKPWPHYTKAVSWLIESTDMHKQWPPLRRRACGVKLSSYLLEFFQDSSSFERRLAFLGCLSFLLCFPFLSFIQPHPTRHFHCSLPQVDRTQTRAFSQFPLLAFKRVCALFLGSCTHPGRGSYGPRRKDLRRRERAENSTSRPLSGLLWWSSG